MRRRLALQRARSTTRDPSLRLGIATAWACLALVVAFASGAGGEAGGEAQDLDARIAKLRADAAEAIGDAGNAPVAATRVSDELRDLARRLPAAQAELRHLEEVRAARSAAADGEGR
jgi:hypothetical protein